MKAQMKAQFITAAEVAEIMGVSRTKAYRSEEHTSELQSR